MLPTTDQPAVHADLTGNGSADRPADHALVGPIIGWYEEHARDLPWRAPGVRAWPVLVSEVMLQQTPVNRVLPVWQEWVERWPEPADLAREVPGEAIRAWGRLGYPRRALRLHDAATAIVERHGGEVPDDHEQLLALPGIGIYTAAAVATFAFGRRHPVVDVNVRRVQARMVTGDAQPADNLSRAEMALAQRLLPLDERIAGRWSIAVMELGAMVCVARTPRCGLCPVAGSCAWLAAGSPAHAGPKKRGQAWEGTDRQVRGQIIAALREATDPLGAAELERAVPNQRDPFQRARALDGLVADRLVEPLPDNRFQLPGGRAEILDRGELLDRGVGA